MTTQLANHFVAFIDLLGFSNMVKHDCESPETAHKYINKLKATHKQTKDLKDEIKDLQLIQFSDSVVLALPYNRNTFTQFATLVSNYQYELLQNGILCRGGISYGMHYCEDDFLFSSGLIHAYNIEKDISITPRIVISSELISLLYPTTQDIPNQIIKKENDGAYFINYLYGRNPDLTKEKIISLIPNGLSTLPSIRGKQIWLIDYHNYQHPTHTIDSQPKFT